jgi:DNA-binding CsgD family transcriptional regulator
VTELISELLDSAKLLVDLQQMSEVAQSLSGGLTTHEIAQKITNALGDRFGCAFSRIWLVEPDQTALKLVASSGLHTRTDGFFSRVPMGAYKVGKIAQNRITFLSNNLPEETWVKDRDWAIRHNIRGFAGFPLMMEERVVGVLATFSHFILSSEFLEVLRVLCTLATVALEAALDQRHSLIQPAFNHQPLSDQLASILRSTPLTLTGTEHPLPLSTQWVFLSAAEVLEVLRCNYCWLTYRSETVELTAIIATPRLPTDRIGVWIDSALSHLLALVSYLGGTLQTQLGTNSTTVQVQLSLPAPISPSMHSQPVDFLGLTLSIRCQQPLLQSAFTQLAYTAGLSVTNTLDTSSPVLTDDLTQCSTAQPIIWIQTGEHPDPKQIQAKVDLSLRAADLRAAVAAVTQGEAWGLDRDKSTSLGLSEREVETLKLLAQGLRDRDIAETLFISESTVKFHMNNVLSKLRARTRYQALYQATINGWI